MISRPTVASEQELQAPPGLWWAFLATGILSGGAGVLLIVRPDHSLRALAVIIGIFLLIDGSVELLAAIVDRPTSALRVIIGVLALIVGIALIRHPVEGVTFVAVVFGIWLIAAGAISLVRAIAEPGHRILGAIVGVLELGAGLVIVAEPHIGYTTLAIIGGVWLVLNAFALVVLAFVIRRAGSQPDPAG